jgi:hypothetical protein
MAHTIKATVAGDAGNAILVEVSNREGSAEFTAKLPVPENSSLLIATVTDGGPDGHRRAANGVNVRLRDPHGNDRTTTMHRDNCGRLVALIPSPEAGEWSLSVSHAGHASAEINAAALGNDWLNKLRRMGGWLACSTCKQLLRALVIAAVIYLAPIAPIAKGAALGWEFFLAHLPAAVTAALAVLLSSSEAARLLQFLLGYLDEAIDRVLHRACHWLRLCDSPQ